MTRDPNVIIPVVVVVALVAVMLFGKALLKIVVWGGAAALVVAGVWQVVDFHAVAMQAFPELPHWGWLPW